MKARTIIYFFFLVLLVTGINALERGPVAVSPGIEGRVAMVGQSCPTFSWTGVEWAEAYRVAVFEAFGTETLPYDEMKAMASPVLSKEIQGLALSWTPSSEERLSNGGVYVWYVQAVDALGTGIWSEGKAFKVEVEARLVGMVESVRERLKEHGVSEDVIDDVLRDMESGVKEVMVWGVDTASSGSKTQDKIGIQGLEGATNTFYGIDAGASITTGSRNTFIGRSSGYSNTSADGNTFGGYHAGYSNNTGANNTFLGREAGQSNTDGFSNTFLGSGAGNSNSTGYYNTFLGQAAGYYNTSGYGNIFIGLSAGASNTIGNNNTFMGRSAGYSNSTGNGNVFLGNQVGYNETGSNRLYIDNSSTSSPLIYGEFDNDIVAINGKLGVGTISPGYPMHLQKTGANAAFIADRTDGAINYINATAGYGNFGTVNNYPLRMVVNAVWRMRLDSDNSLTMANGATCTSGGVWTDASSRDLKENIHCLTTEEAIDALKDLNPVKYNYKADKEEGCVGFIAEEVPDLVASKDRKGMSPMDVVAVLTKVVQEQQKRDREQQKVIDELRKEIEELKKK